MSPSSAGLGLYVSKVICERNKGDISCFSLGLGHGSTFEFRMKMQHEPEVRHNRRRTTSSKLLYKHIITYEDILLLERGYGSGSGSNSDSNSNSLEKIEEE